MIAVAAYAIAILLIGPWGNYPLNDDWQYAWITKRWLESGRLFVDLPIAPALVGQSIIAYPWLKLFGFSHMALRALTVLFAVGLVFALDGLLRLARVAPRLRAAALLLVVFNPLFMHLSLSFMTEIYGYALAFAGVWTWFRSRETADRKGDAPLVSWPAALGSALLIGATFWIRQFCVLLFPAAVGATLLNELFKGQAKRLKSSALRLSVASILFLAAIAGYLAWAHMNGEMQAAFSTHLSGLKQFRGLAYPKEWAAFWAYMSAFFLPALLAIPILAVGAKAKVRPGTLKWLVPLLLVVFYGLARMQHDGARFFSPAAFVHKSFPMLGNVIYDAGLGPITLTRLYQQGWREPLDHPHWPSAVWWALYAILVLALPVLFGAAFGAIRRRGATISRIGREVHDFGLLLALGLWFVSVQAFGIEIFDRYHFANFLGLVLTLAVFAEELLTGVQWKAQWRHWAFRAVLGLASFAFLGTGFFSVAGAHDYFRWNDVRWKIFEQAQASGLEPESIDAGYETNGWVEAAKFASSDAIDQAFAPSRTYRISMNPSPGFSTMQVYPVHGWLAHVPPLVLERRNLIDKMRSQ